MKCIARYFGVINERPRANEGANKKINEQWLSRLNYRHIEGLSFLLSCLNIYFSLQPVISVTREWWRRQLYEINACAITELFLCPWIRENRVSCAREPIRISANKEIVDLRLFHFFHVTCSPHFIAFHEYLNSTDVVGQSIFFSTTGDCRRNCKRNMKMVRWEKKYILILH